MKTTEIISIVAAMVSGCSLAMIQIRRIVSGEVSPFGLQGIKELAKTEIDRLDKRLLLLSGSSFIVCIVFGLLSYK